MDFRSSDMTDDRDLDCESSIEADFEALAERAVAAGWGDDEVANALLSLAQARIETTRADAFIGRDPLTGRLPH
ncbi:hypothetical protein [Oricola nitratireducens]|jgi:hypothetical protein|uniref:hypothetical protein n=1 Tax=Oricola nitratireducens TaxID=2775868 RepID=UPI001865F402|nr:hypothetical protein [Oricola nitratireducens]